MGSWVATDKISLQFPYALGVLWRKEINISWEVIHGLGGMVGHEEGRDCDKYRDHNGCLSTSQSSWIPMCIFRARQASSNWDMIFLLWIFSCSRSRPYLTRKFQQMLLGDSSVRDDQQFKPHPIVRVLKDKVLSLWTRFIKDYSKTLLIAAWWALSWETQDHKVAFTWLSFFCIFSGATFYQVWSHFWAHILLSHILVFLLAAMLCILKHLSCDMGQPY